MSATGLLGWLSVVELLPVELFFAFQTVIPSKCTYKLSVNQILEKHSFRFQQQKDDKEAINSFYSLNLTLNHYIHRFRLSHSI